MTIILPLLMLMLIFAIVATCFTEGIWSNVVRLINVITAGLLAMTFFEPLARALDSWQPSYTYLWDFCRSGGCSASSCLIFREITDRVSHVNVRFLKLADRIGGVVLSLWIGWVMVCFTMMTLHTAPLGRNFLFGGFSTEKDARMIFGMARPTWNGWGSRRRCRPARSPVRSGEVDQCRLHAEIRHPSHGTQKHVAARDSLRVGP